MAKRLEIGDRVRARALSPVPSGTLGRVAQTLISAPELYFVRFDGYEHWRLMRASDLELVADAPSDADAS
jgi:hypothetical protein